MGIRLDLYERWGTVCGLFQTRIYFGKALSDIDIRNQGSGNLRIHQCDAYTWERRQEH